MFNFNSDPLYEVIYVIVNYGMGSKVLHKAKKYGIHGGTIFLGTGTIKNPIMKFLSLYEEKKEILILGADRDKTQSAMIQLTKDFNFEENNHGIIFSVSILGIFGSSFNQCSKNNIERRNEKPMYNLIIIIVDKGKGSNVVDVSLEAGANGGTLINARGSGEHETVKLFNMDIEPEKEIALIISTINNTESIVNSIRDKMEIDKPGNGILFVQTINQVYGLFEQ